MLAPTLWKALERLDKPAIARPILIYDGMAVNASSLEMSANPDGAAGTARIA
jgi:hypothetical protein